MSYETIYGASILDDIHNYFPEFLYNNSRFTNIQDVFNYINTVNNQFSGFNQGRSLYRNEAGRAGNFTARQAGVKRRLETPVGAGAAAEVGTGTQNEIENATPRTAVGTPVVTARTTTRTAAAATPQESRRTRTTTTTRAVFPRAVPVPTAAAAAPTVPAVAAAAAAERSMSPNIQPRILSASYSVYPQLNQTVDEISFEGVLPSPFLQRSLGLGTNLGPLIDASGSRVAEQTEQLIGELFGNVSGVDQVPVGANDLLSVFFQTILNPQGAASTSAAGTPNFLEPVPIRPSARQIVNSTTLTRLDTSGNDVICPICQDEINNTQVVRRINHCAHNFHQNCLDQHFQNSVRCPMCRFDIRENQAPIGRDSNRDSNNYSAMEN